MRISAICSVIFRSLKVGGRRPGTELEDGRPHLSGLGHVVVADVLVLIATRSQDERDSKLGEDALYNWTG